MKSTECSDCSLKHNEILRKLGHEDWIKAKKGAAPPRRLTDEVSAPRQRAVDEVSAPPRSVAHNKLDKNVDKNPSLPSISGSLLMKAFLDSMNGDTSSSQKSSTEAASKYFTEGIVPKKISPPAKSDFYSLSSSSASSASSSSSSARSSSSSVIPPVNLKSLASLYGKVADPRRDMILQSRAAVKVIATPSISLGSDPPPIFRNASRNVLASFVVQVNPFDNRYQIFNKQMSGMNGKQTMFFPDEGFIGTPFMVSGQDVSQIAVSQKPTTLGVNADGAVGQWTSFIEVLTLNKNVDTSIGPTIELETLPIYDNTNVPSPLTTFALAPKSLYYMMKFIPKPYIFSIGSKVAKQPGNFFLQIIQKDASIPLYVEIDPLNQQQFSWGSPVLLTNNTVNALVSFTYDPIQRLWAVPALSATTTSPLTTVQYLAKTGNCLQGSQASFLPYIVSLDFLFVTPLLGDNSNTFDCCPAQHSTVVFPFQTPYYIDRNFLSAKTYLGVPTSNAFGCCNPTQPNKFIPPLIATPVACTTLATTGVPGGFSVKGQVHTIVAANTSQSATSDMFCDNANTCPYVSTSVSNSRNFIIHPPLVYTKIPMTLETQYPYLFFDAQTGLIDPSLGSSDLSQGTFYNARQYTNPLRNWSILGSFTMQYAAMLHLCTVSFYNPYMEAWACLIPIDNATSPDQVRLDYLRHADGMMQDPNTSKLFQFQLQLANSTVSGDAPNVFQIRPLALPSEATFLQAVIFDNNVGSTWIDATGNSDADNFLTGQKWFQFSQVDPVTGTWNILSFDQRTHAPYNQGSLTFSWVCENNKFNGSPIGYPNVCPHTSQTSLSNQGFIGGDNSWNYSLASQWQIVVRATGPYLQAVKAAIEAPQNCCTNHPVDPATPGPDGLPTPLTGLTRESFQSFCSDIGFYPSGQTKPGSPACDFFMCGGACNILPNINNGTATIPTPVAPLVDGVYQIQPHGLMTTNGFLDAPWFGTPLYLTPVTDNSGLSMFAQIFGFNDPQHAPTWNVVLVGGTHNLYTIQSTGNKATGTMDYMSVLPHMCTSDSPANANNVVHLDFKQGGIAPFSSDPTVADPIATPANVSFERAIAANQHFRVTLIASSSSSVAFSIANVESPAVCTAAQAVTAPPQTSLSQSTTLANSTIITPSSNTLMTNLQQQWRFILVTPLTTSSSSTFVSPGYSSGWCFDHLTHPSCACLNPNNFPPAFLENFQENFSVQKPGGLVCFNPSCGNQSAVGSGQYFSQDQANFLPCTNVICENIIKISGGGITAKNISQTCEITIAGSATATDTSVVPPSTSTSSDTNTVPSTSTSSSTSTSVKDDLPTWVWIVIAVLAALFLVIAVMYVHQRSKHHRAMEARESQAQYGPAPGPSPYYNYPSAANPTYNGPPSAYGT